MSRNSMAVLSAVLVLVTLQCGDILHSTAYLESCEYIDFVIRYSLFVQLVCEEDADPL
jgi:hypothetical protein